MPEAKEVPDIYSDLFTTNVNALGAIVGLSKSVLPTPGNQRPNPEPVAVLRYSLENYKVYIMTARKQLKEMETKAGKPIHLPVDLLQSLDLTEADW